MGGPASTLEVAGTDCVSERCAFGGQGRPGPRALASLHRPGGGKRVEKKSRRSSHFCDFRGSREWAAKTPQIPDTVLKPDKVRFRGSGRAGSHSGTSVWVVGKTAAWIARATAEELIQRRGCEPDRVSNEESLFPWQSPPGLRRAKGDPASGTGTVAGARSARARRWTARIYPTGGCFWKICLR